MVLIKAHIRIAGLVQGVFFRATMCKKALDLGINGWVKNLPDGNVEALTEGEEEKISEIVKWCKIGPKNAHVKEVSVSYEPSNGEFTEFLMKF